MGKILKFIEEATEGECFTSFKYSYDDDKVPGIEYETQEETYINLKEYAEEVKVKKHYVAKDGNITIKIR